MFIDLKIINDENELVVPTAQMTSAGEFISSRMLKFDISIKTCAFQKR